MPLDAPMIDTAAIKAGRLDDAASHLISDYLKAMPTLPRVGAVIAERWRIERLLGEGGFGAVFEGRDQQLGRKVAIKVLRGDAKRPADALELREALTRMEERRRRFRDEARAVARAESPNVVTVYDVGEVDDGHDQRWPFLVLELVEGTPLDRVVRERPSPEVALHIFEQLTRGVATLHARRVVHRDLKPANAILTADGRVKIIDFGLAIAASDWTEVVGPKAPEEWIEGTPQYMSPEVTRGGEPDEASDLWALGVMAYELLTGRTPWGDHLTLPELEQRIARAEPPPIAPRSGSDARWIAHLTPIVMKLLAKRPADRYASAAEVEQALADLRQSVGARDAGGPRDGDQPYRYLLAFEEKDASWFFGREDVTAKLALALEQKGRLVVAGPSGAGKTSVIQAGLIPELKVLRPLEVVRVQPGRDPLARLAAAVPAVDGKTLDAAAIRAQPGLVGEHLRQHARATKKRVLVQIDALEELITQAPAAPTAESAARWEADVDTFGQVIEGLRDDGANRSVLVVMAVRDEYLGRLPRLSRALESALRDAEFLAPPSRAAMLMALVRPARRLGVTWQEGFPEEMVDAVQGQASPLPVLQLAASWVWEKHMAGSPPGLLATVAGSAAGPAGTPAPKVLERSLLANEGEALRIGDVLGQYADHKLRAASWSEADRERVKRLLPALVSAEGTPLVVPVDEVLARAGAQPTERARAEELLRDLTDFRLLTGLRDERGRQCLTPVHTTLIRGWRLMREALEGNAELEAFLRRFERDARDWDASARDPAKLWSAAALRDFDRWRGALANVQLAPAQGAFRDAVVAQARRGRLLRWAFVGLLGAAALGGTIAGVAFSQKADEAAAAQSEAEAQRALADTQRRASVEHRREADELIDYMLGDLRARLEPIGQVQVLRAVAEKARAYLDARAGGADDDEGDALRRAQVLRTLGAVFAQEGDTTASERAFRESMAITEHLHAVHPDDADYRRAQAIGHTELGGVLATRGDPGGALESYKSALILYDQLAAAAPSDVAAQRDLSMIQERIGDVMTSLGKLDAAEMATRASMAITLRLAATEPDDLSLQRDLSVAENKLGQLLELRGDFAASRVQRESALARAQKLAAAQPDSARAQRDLSISHAALGDALRLLQLIPQALEHYREALSVDTRLAAADPSDMGAQRDLEVSQNKVGDVLLQQGDTAAARALYETALAIAERLATLDPHNVTFQTDLAQCRSRLGQVLVTLGEVDRGLGLRKGSVDIYAALDERIGTGSARFNHANARLLYAWALTEAGRAADAKAEATRADAMLAELAQRPDPPPGTERARELLAPLLK